MKFRKQQARLERRQVAYANTIKSLGPGRSEGFIKPGSGKKPAPKGR